MKPALSRLSVGEIRQRYLGSDRPISPQLLNQLRRDPRQGVRELYVVLRRRQERERTERLRMDALLNFERLLWQSGLERIAGVDEAGTGPLAGPVVAAAVVFPPGTKLAGIDDSKRLNAEQRAEAEQMIRNSRADISVGLAEVEEIDRLNVYHAALLAMRRAIEGLPVPPQHILVDARRIPEIDVPQNCFNKGDGLNFSIAAASIIAKTYRDRLMSELAIAYPQYGFNRHKGYPTPEHQAAIRQHGPSPIHRMSFKFIRELCGEYSVLFYQLKHRLAMATEHSALAAVESELEAKRSALAEEEGRKLRTMLARRWKTL